MAAFFGEFVVELVKGLILAAVALCAMFAGKKLRQNKDAK